MDIDYSAEILKNSIKYLLEASETVPNNLPSVKSYYASKSRILGLQGNINLPPTVIRSTLRCPRCCLSFTDYPVSVILKPPEETNPFLKKIQRKSKNGDMLTLYQKKHTNDAKIFNCNIISKTCQNCKWEGKTYIKKEEKQRIGNNVPTKKKKRKKDKFCGLLQEAVINSSKNEQKTVENKQINTTPEIQRISLGQEKQKNPDKLPFKQKTAKEKIIERKQKKTNKKLINNLQTLLNDSNKSNTVVRLKSFLHDL